MEEQNIKLRAFAQVIFIIFVGFAVIKLASLVVGNKSNEEVVKNVAKEIILKKPSCPDTKDTFNSLKSTGQIVTLVKDVKSHGENQAFVNNKFTIVKSFGSGSQIACGYLYVRAQAGKRPLSLDWEHPYIRPGQFGGHIITSGSIIPSEKGTANEFLFNLSKIEYWISQQDRQPRKADWAALLNVTDEVEFELGLNTENKEGVLEEVSIVYQCWSPETGQITHDCKLEVK